MQHGKVCIRERLYTGKNQDQYRDRHLSNILNDALEGELFPSVLKGFLWGQCLRAKGVKNCFGGSKEYRKNATRESLYTGKFVYGKESGPVYIDRHLSNILNNALEGGVFPSVLKGFLWGQCLRAKGV